MEAPVHIPEMMISITCHLAYLMCHGTHNLFIEKKLEMFLIFLVLWSGQLNNGRELPSSLRGGHRLLRRDLHSWEPHCNTSDLLSTFRLLTTLYDNRLCKIFSNHWCVLFRVFPDFCSRSSSPPLPAPTFCPNYIDGYFRSPIIPRTIRTGFKVKVSASFAATAQIIHNRQKEPLSSNQPFLSSGRIRSNKIIRLFALSSSQIASGGTNK